MIKKKPERIVIQAAEHSGGVDAAPDWLEKRFPSYNSFIVTALPIARIVG
jgi:hypothetical protein